MEDSSVSESEPLMSQYSRDSSEKGSIQSLSKKKRYRVDNFLPCDPRRWMHRFLMLALMCMLSFGEL